ncbi:MAG: TonB-dependent receptor [Gammaproteobacteria bacterium]|nr:TonB-dependent receptor [Gammaproteobacteria bacterium]
MIHDRTFRGAAALGLASLFLLIAPPALADDDDDSSEQRRIEEMVIYGERVESTVSDTSIAITAMDEDFLRDMGMQGPNEMVNFIPATTRTDWDIKIRGIGRNFRGLGGDPGVGTYYNGIYSPDFGIAATEGGLYDIRRIEVLRGPQGTLYGRNSIGGVVNYVTNQPNHEGFEANVRAVLGEYGTNEWFGLVSGPVTENFAYRLTGVKRIRGPAVDGHAGSEDIQDVNDQNFALILEWTPADSMTFNLRVNDRRAYSKNNFGNGGHGIAGEGPCIGQHPITSDSQCDPRYRVSRDTNYYATGFRAVGQDWVDKYGDLADDPRGAVGWIHPTTGETFYGAYNRPGVDDFSVRWPFMPSQNYRSASVATYDIGGADAPDIVGLTTGDNREEFDHQQASLVWDWDINDRVSIKYLGSYNSFAYWFNRDNSFSDSHVSDIDDTVIEQVESYSHELRVFWELGDRFTATSGVYQFWESRDQWYGIRERGGQGRARNAAIYGPEGWDTWLLDSLAVVGWIFPPCIGETTHGSGAGGDLNFGDATRNYGAYCGDPGKPYSQSWKTGDTGALYEHRNLVDNENLAFYTQGDLRLTDTLSVTLGVRYSKDWRDAKEQRGGYSEIEVFNKPWLPWAISTACALNPDRCPENPLSFFAPGVTPLAALNVAMGAATFTGDPDFPIAPVCNLEAYACDRPLRLRGVPIGWGHRTLGTYKQDGDVTWRVNFNWEPTPDMLVYLGATAGYRAGGFNLGNSDGRIELDTDGDGATDTRAIGQYGDENLIAYELGYKGTHLDGTLQLNIAVYYYDYENYQTNVSTWESEGGDFALPNITLPGGGGLEAPAGRGPVDTTKNIDQANNKGFEVDATYLATDNFTIGGNYSFTESTFNTAFTFFNENDPRYPREILGGDVNQDPCTLPAEIRSLYCIEIDGEDLTGIPKHKATLWAAYTWNRPSGSWTWYNSIAYTGDYATTPFHRPWDLVPERERWDMRLTYREATGRWSASAFVDNVLDKTYIRHSDMENRRTGYGANWPQRVVALYPRYWGVEFEYSMGAYR